MNTIEVPARGRKWRIGALVRDSDTHELYRVGGNPMHFHEDCLPVQKVSKVRDIPDEWRGVLRLLAIMEQVRTQGCHTPESRGADAGTATASCPPMPDPVQWEARREPQSRASFPRLVVSGDTLSYIEPIYDDSPIVTWLADAALAKEARDLIARKLSLCRYEQVRVRQSQ
jgi:hypothetical protein